MIKVTYILKNGIRKSAFKKESELKEALNQLRKSKLVDYYFYENGNLNFDDNRSHFN